MSSNSIENTKVVILIGGRDFGRCPIATRLNRALWPIAGKPVVQHLIERLAAQGLRQFVICCDAQAGDIRGAVTLPEALDIRWIEQQMPRGTAGSVLDAAEPGSDELLMVFVACMICPPDVQEVLAAHRDGAAGMSVFFNPVDKSNAVALRDAGVYVCRSSVLSHIPQKGYFDIKEGLIPALVSAKEPAYAGKLSRPVGNFTTWRQYLTVLGRALNDGLVEPQRLSDVQPLGTSGVQWAGKDVHIAESARICGPVLVEAGAKIEADAVILGPGIIGKNVRIGQNTVVCQSIIWDNAVIGRGCHLRRSLVDYQRTIPGGAVLDGTAAALPKGRLSGLAEGISMRIKQITQSQVSNHYHLADPLAQCLKHPRLKWTLIGMTGLLFAVLFVTYWRPTLVDLWKVWLHSDEYSCGLLVPFLAGYVMWVRRRSFLDSPVNPAFTGLVVLLAAQALRLFGLYYMFGSAERLALVLSVGGIVLLVYGWVFFRKFLPVFVFLFLMLPFPHRVESMITLPLQQYATVSAVFSLETLGYNVVREGNIIRIGDTVVAVAEACNGLRMLTAFFVISGFVVLISSRKLWEKAVLLISAIPIALLCNTIRLTLTSIAFTYVHSERMEELFHDFGGLAMMPLAIGIILLELWLMKLLFYPPETVEHQVVFSRNSS